jgi:hypothetical protein
MTVPDLQRLATVQQDADAGRAVLRRLGADLSAGPSRDQLTADTLHRCREARAAGAVSGAWSTGQQLLVALVLNDTAHLAALDYTAQQAHERVYANLPVPMTPQQYVAWLNDLRLELR